MTTYRKVYNAANAGEAMEEAISNLEEAYDGMDDIISSVEAAGE